MSRLAVGAIAVRDLHKSFRIYKTHSLKDSAVHLARGEPLWERRMVLNGISFDVTPGERIGVVGRNGAGKSTLFRLLTRVLRPDNGSVDIGGRVAPLIEVTAGFVPDMTARENAFLNGVILGVSSAAMTKKMDQILDFAGVTEFADTPVRYFSSGMQARLGFAIVAFVDADVVLVDEVLAVGDLAFQAKCIARMDEIARTGATVVFVSHDFRAVQAFCNRVIWLKDGRLFADGAPAPTLAACEAEQRAEIAEATDAA